MLLADTSGDLMTSQHSVRYEAIVQGAAGKQAGGRMGAEQLGEMRADRVQSRFCKHLQGAAASVWM